MDEPVAQVNHAVAKTAFILELQLKADPTEGNGNYVPIRLLNLTEYDLPRFHLQTGVLELFKNPFGPKVSPKVAGALRRPMSPGGRAYAVAWGACLPASRPIGHLSLRNFA